MNPGQLDREINLLQRVPTLDASKSPVLRWFPLLSNLPAGRVSTARATEVFLADDVRSRVTEVFRTHYLDRKLDLGALEDKDLRIEFDDGIYEVLGIVEDAKAQRRQASLILCTKISGRVHNP